MTTTLTPTITDLTYVYDDGGRSATDRKGTASDCVTRALAIAAGIDYDFAYDELAFRMQAKGKPRSARNGIPNDRHAPGLRGL